MMNSKPNVLVIDEAFSSTKDSGKRIRTASLLEHCSHDFSITYVAFASDNDEAEIAKKVWGHFGVEVIPVRPPRVWKSGISQLWTAGRILFRNKPASVAAWQNKLMPNMIDKLIGERNFDLIHCELTQMAWALPFNSEIPTVLNAHNVETVVWERLAEISKPPMRWVYNDQAKKMESFERLVLGRFNKVIAVSNVDSVRLSQRFGVVDAIVIENGTSQEMLQPVQHNYPKEILYPGALDWRPSQDAVAYLLREIFPEIRKIIPDLNLKVVGRNPPKWLRKLCDKTAGVTCYPNVPSMTKYYENADLVVVPLRVGSGSRLKILESFAFGRPVVSTSIGAEGLNVQNGQHLSLVDGTAAFVGEVVHLLENPEKCNTYITEAKALVDQFYTWSYLGEKFAAVWSTAIKT